MMSKIINFIKENKWWLIAIAILAIIICILINSNKNLRDDNKILENNNDALLEEVDSLELSNGQLLYERQSYITSLDDINKYLSCTKKEIKDMQKKIDEDIIYISELESKVNIVNRDTVFLKVEDNNIYNIVMSDEKWYKIEESIRNEKDGVLVSLNNLNVDVPLTVGLDEQWKIFVTSPNPYVSFSNINGAVLDRDLYLKQQKKKRWSLGVSVGIYGGYDLIHKNIYAGPGLGLSLSYNFLSW